MIRTARSGVTLLELLIAVTLLGLLSVGIVLSLRVALSAMNKTDSKLMANRRVVGVERILEQQVAGLMPVTAGCGATDGNPGIPVIFFQGAPDSMRIASTYSLQQAARGLPMILEYQVIGGENGQGVRLVVNEHLYSGPRSAGAYCAGMGMDPISGTPGTLFVPIQVGPGSFVLADKLEFCKLSYRDVPNPNYPAEAPKWLASWTKSILPSAIRFEMAPLIPDPARVQPVTLTIPVHVTRRPLEPYGNQ
ncbi:MAG TPA: prepilin-type N-terminal cleavage/methylation domain-containing protein [Bryobacteraceae bacterium]|nr:prepilin-type N-terminal cleavage/methylation domain-containing protein [Bryobacteraceae bacterium]